MKGISYLIIGLALVGLAVAGTLSQQGGIMTWNGNQVIVADADNNLNLQGNTIENGSINLSNLGNIYFFDPKIRTNITTCPNRPFFSTQNLNIYVGATHKYQKINDAVCEIPFYNSHIIYIYVDTDYNETEDIILPSVYGSSIIDVTEGQVGTVYIYGVNFPKINSIHVINSKGVYAYNIRRLNITGRTPYSDENSSVFAISSDLRFIDTIFSATNANYAYVAYGGGHTKIQSMNITGNYPSAILAKHASMISVRDGSINGVVSGTAYQAQAGGIIFIKNNGLTYSNYATTTDQGLIFDIDNGHTYGINGFKNTVIFEDDLNIDDRIVLRNASNIPQYIIEQNSNRFLIKTWSGSNRLLSDSTQMNFYQTIDANKYSIINVETGSTFYSPNGTLFTCGPDNTGTWVCS